MQRDFTSNRVFTVYRPDVRPASVETWASLRIARDGIGKRQWFILCQTQEDGTFPFVGLNGNVARFATADAARDRMMAIFNQTDRLHHHPKQGIRMPV